MWGYVGGGPWSTGQGLGASGIDDLMGSGFGNLIPGPGVRYGCWGNGVSPRTC